MTTEITDASFAQDVLASDIPVVVDFWAPWCGPCVSMAPIVDALAAQYQGRVNIVKVNIDETDIAAKYGVRGIPTFKAFSEGNVVDTLVGSHPKARLEALIDSLL